MPTFAALREKPTLSPYGAGDVLVLFGELFQRGYANGLVEEAERRGLTVVRATVGRRDKDGQLRPLTAEEASLHPAPFLNVPLEAGFDFETDSKGRTPVDQLRDIKLTDWEKAQLDFQGIEEARQKGVARFRRQTEIYLKELEAHLPPGKNVLFAHLMAGGVPRAKIVMPLMNRAFKGQGERHIPSQEFWEGPIGRLCSTSFLEVTAETFRHLVELSSSLRQKIETAGGRVSYLAYGYHGTEVWHGDGFRWQTYTPYLQGEAKKHLEDLSRGFSKQGIRCSVYNCPEILTNSSSIFQGVELSLYPLLDGFKALAPQSPTTKKLLSDCARLLKNGEASFAEITRVTQAYFQDPEILRYMVFEKWPQHSGQKQMETMLQLSDHLISLHQDEKQLLTAVLSEAVFEACGQLMFHDSWQPQDPVQWIGHDVIVKTLA